MTFLAYSIVHTWKKEKLNRIKDAIVHQGKICYIVQKCVLMFMYMALQGIFYPMIFRTQCAWNRMCNTKAGITKGLYMMFSMGNVSYSWVKHKTL